ncbi:MAG: glycoside hydrolase family 88 protein [Bacteroidaceae bacterium]|nr:glycoside hydrolase family 88 protein [Bacteroidaceae bacterium]
MKRILLSLCGAMALLCALPLRAQTEKISEKLPMSVRLAESEMVRCPESWQLDFQPKLKWDYCHGVELQAFLRLEEMYGDSRYFDYAESYCDTMVREDGTVVAYKREEYSLDRVNTGKILFNMYARTGEEKYKKALDLMYSQFEGQPRTKEGGFWHKKVYPHQMWLDGLYMGCPFYAEYAARYDKPEAFQDVINQFCVVARHTYDPATGLYKHAWDESREQFWCDKTTGQSAHSWGRAMGWFAMALVESLEFIPVDEPNRDSLLLILDNVVKQIERYQDSKTGLWYQVLDRSGDKGNYLESTVSAMFIYTLYKGIRLGVVPASYMKVADKGFEGFMKRFIKVGKKGLVSITDCCAVAGLGGKNMRSGNYEYYINETIRDNDPKAIGPFINVCLERERLTPHEGPVTVENKHGKIRILMIGDSTMANKSMKNGSPERGWGMVLQHFFTDAVEVDNHAQNGRSTKSFINEGRWDKVLARIRPGDYVFIQFGHNDEKYNKEAVYTVPGGTFDANLRRFVMEARQRGGIPVLFNAIVRRKFDGQRLTCTHGDYLLPPRRVAEQTAAYFVDANAITHGIVEPMGPEDSKRLFMWLPKGSPSHPKGLQDDTHLNVYGAHRVAWSLISAVCNQIPRLEQHVKYFDFSDL